MSNSKITPEHLARDAIVYIRQSTPHQVVNNLESKRRQYGLVERGKALGWNDVQVIDDDLGRSANGDSTRHGFEKLLARICEGSVGIIMSIEASRLARNGREWHTLLEFCAFTNCLIADENQIYDPRQPDDRLVLGMKGTMSEMELSILHQRAGEARKQKARRGELFGIVAIGYLKSDRNRIEKDPNRRIQDAISLVFNRFADLQSARQVLLWTQQERILLPTLVHKSDTRSIEWRAPKYRTIYHILTNPVYAGAYVFGRTKDVAMIEHGHKRIIRRKVRNWTEWDVLIKEHHEEYISWEEFERNQRLIADNANRKSNIGRGSVRQGEALLAGLCRCGRCVKKIKGQLTAAMVSSNATFAVTITKVLRDMKCTSFGGPRVDRSVAQEVIDRLQPLGIEAALAATNDHGQEQLDERRQLEKCSGSGHALRLGAHIVNTTKSIHPTDWTLPRWSGDGMRDWSMFVRA